MSIYGEDIVRWHSLTPAERWRESMAMWARTIELGIRVDDVLDHDDVDARTAPLDVPHEGHRPSGE